MREVWICRTCGSPDCEEAAWVGVNDRKIAESGPEGPVDQVWCPKCQTNLPSRAALVGFAIGDLVEVSKEGAEHVAFEGQRTGRIVRFGENVGEPDALLDGDGDGGRWALLRHMTKK